jgi:cytochrome c oxidase assembly protein subunit 15
MRRGAGSVLTPPADGSPLRSRRDRHDRALRAVALSATAVTFGLIAAGALVRATGSGEGCTGWPKCSASSWLPPLAYHPIIEYSHRMTAFVDIVLVGVLVVVAARRYRGVRRVFRTAWLAVGLVIAQAVLGGIVVKGDLAALLVTAHFGTAMILAGVLVYASVAAFSVAVRPVGPVDPFTSLARAAAGATFVLMAVGAYVRGQNAGLAFGDWPLMEGRLVPRLSSTPAALQFTHRLLALVVGVLVAVLAVRAGRLGPDRRPAVALAFVVAGLFVAQVLVGAANVWSRLAPPAVVAHVALAGLVWGAVVATAAASRACASSGAGEVAARPSLDRVGEPEPAT